MAYGAGRKFAKRAMDALAGLGKACEDALAADAVLLKGFPRRLQLDSHSCGLQCASMILAFHGKSGDPRGLERQLGSTEDGVDQRRLRSLFERRGLKPRRINKPTLGKIRTAIDRESPVLVYVDGDHWAVVYGYSAGAMYVADPALNRSVFCRHSKEAFQRRWQRWAMEVEK